MKSELEQLIAEQARDMKNYRVWSKSVDEFPSGADITQIRRKLKAHDDRHGKLHCYTVLGCRCAKCRGAMAEWTRKYRAKKVTTCSDGCGRTVGSRAGRCLSCAMKRVHHARRGRDGKFV